ncbi:hypothetical protein [Streptomyces sp. NPDC090112]|uniref:hypothetical protein n=1 Tax=Streptomyces sp. NPDC090112 TaxID=3365949 RepID=UPI003824A570
MRWCGVVVRWCGAVVRVHPVRTTMRTTVHPVRIHSVGGAHRRTRVVRIRWVGAAEWTD